MSETSDATVAALIAAQRRELVRRRRWVLACRFASLSFAAWYLHILIIQGLDAAFYISVNLFAIVTGLSGFVAVDYFDPPLLIRHLHLGDEPLRRAAWAALQPLRGEILPTLLQDLAITEPERSRLVAEIDADELVRRTAPKLRRDRKKFGRIWLAVYVPIALAFIVLVATYESVP
jgi:hypothetical protein